MSRQPQLREILTVTLLCALGLIAWEVAGATPKAGLLISAPSKVLRYFAVNMHDLMDALRQTSFEAFAGIIVATAVTFALMLLCFLLPKLLDALVTVTAVSQVVPLITLAPMFILLFGIGTLSKVVMASLVCFFPIFIGFATGVRQISSEVRTVLYMYNATVLQRIRWAYLPQSLPSLMSGLKVASTLAVIGAIVAEFNGADVGLGKNLFIAAKKLEPELMMSSLILSSLLGGGLFLAIAAIERIVGKWYLHNNPL